MSDRREFLRTSLAAAGGAVMKTFFPADAEAVSVFDLPAGASGTFRATSFCNLHDFRLTEFSV